MAIKLMIKIYIPIGSIIYLPLHSIFIIAMNRMKLKKIINKHNPKAKPFFDFRNSLIHRYWQVDDALLIQNIVKGRNDFDRFVREIEQRYQDAGGRWAPKPET